MTDFREPRVELSSAEEFEDYARSHPDLCRVLLEGVDLGEVEVDWGAVEPRGSVLVGCRFPQAELALRLQERGAVVIPALVDERHAYSTYPSGLYDYEGLRAIDAEVEAAVHGPGGGPVPTDPVEAIAQRLHDTAMTDATLELVERWEGRVVGIMGGHRIKRSQPEYTDVVRLAHGLASRGYLVVTGGGPGVMEAGNLGAYLTRASDGEAAIDHAIRTLREADDVHGGLADYEAAAEEVHGRYAGGEGGESLAIPTWHYPEEPVGRFATHIAKYFANSIREDGLLQIADAGVVFARGGAGTMQEVFQNAAINAYAKPEEQAPMVFLGTEAFGPQTGIFETLCRAAEAETTRTKYRHLLRCTDDPEVALRFIEAPPPRPAEAE